MNIHEAHDVLGELLVRVPGAVQEDTKKVWAYDLSLDCRRASKEEGLRGVRALARHVTDKRKLTYASVRSAILGQRTSPPPPTGPTMAPERHRAWVALTLDILDGRVRYPGERGADGQPTAAEARWYVEEVDRRLATRRSSSSR